MSEYNYCLHGLNVQVLIDYKNSTNFFFNTILVLATTTFSQNLVVKWQRTAFSCQNDATWMAPNHLFTYKEIS